MKESKKSIIEKFCEKYGLDPEKFSPAPISPDQRMEEIEACIFELAEIISGEE